MWDDIAEFLIELIVELIDANWQRNKKKKVIIEEIKEDDIKKL